MNQKLLVDLLNYLTLGCCISHGWLRLLFSY